MMFDANKREFWEIWFVVFEIGNYRENTDTYHLTRNKNPILLYVKSFSNFLKSQTAPSMISNVYWVCEFIDLIIVCNIFIESSFFTIFSRKEFSSLSLPTIRRLLE